MALALAILAAVALKVLEMASVVQTSPSVAFDAQLWNRSLGGSENDEMFGLPQQPISLINSRTAWYASWKRPTYLDLLLRRQRKSLLLIKSSLLCFQKFIPLP